MHVRFLFGPAGSGKTFRCLAEIREELRHDPAGPDLLLLAPKQATFQLERQLLGDGSLAGYTRLQILSFERLAAHVLDRLGRPLPELLSEEGRVMVLRAILEARHDQLRVFRASARLAGFARQLSEVLRELQRRQFGPEKLEKLTAETDLPQTLKDKLADLALVLRAYLDWVGSEGGGRLEDGARLLDAAAHALAHAPESLGIGGLWLDGFAEMTPQEQGLLAAVLPHCDRATLAFCLPHEPHEDEPWLSPWAVVSETAHECALRLSHLPDVEVVTEQLSQDPTHNRFSKTPLLAEVERVIAGARCAAPAHVEPEVQTHREPADDSDDAPPLRLVQCANIEAEARLAAREVLAFVQDGGRYRDCAILVRSLEGYQDVLRRVFTRYGIPFFLDRREPVSHHPLAELTRFALRTGLFDWQREDWLGALKTGLAGLTDYEADRLENAALSRGWEGRATWLNPLPADDDLKNRERLEQWRDTATAPFAALEQALANAQGRPTGAALADALRSLWDDLKIESRLQRWAESSANGAVHGTVWEQMHEWLNNVERAFRDVALPMPEWLQIIEAGLSTLSVGVIPPALDQVLVGSVDRSRNPDLKFALVLGVNEGVFPAPPSGVPLFSEADVETLETHNARVSPGRRQFGHERYLGYIALTRARERVLVTWSETDAKGRARSASRFVDELQRAFQQVPIEHFDGTLPWTESRHASELAGALLAKPAPTGIKPLLELPAVQAAVQRWERVSAALSSEALSTDAAARLYGNTLDLSVTALEAFASCPFRFVTAYGLKVRERDEFEVDARQTGSFQHEVLSAFHERVMDTGKPWRDLDAETARRWVREIGKEKLQSFQHGLLLADAGRAFRARALLANLERLVAQMTQWARQNEFEPREVEVSFGMEDKGWPAWTLDLGKGRAVKLRGRIDRVDLLRLNGGTAAVAILDYKSGGKRFEPVKFENGLQLQMPGYLKAICAIPDARKEFDAKALRPAGVFYVGLRPKSQSSKTRVEAEKNSGASAAAKAFQHLGRFDADLLRRFDDRSDASAGDQFKYRVTNKGVPYKKGNDALSTPDFTALLEDTTRQIRELARRIFDGEAAVSPYKKGQETSCGICAFQPICRFDPWLRPFRVLKQRASGKDGKEEARPCG